MTVRLAGERGVREAVLEGLAGSTRVAELLARTCIALGVLEGAEAALRVDSRLLKGEDTLAESGMAERGVVDVCVGEGAGMPGGADDQLEPPGGLRALERQLDQDVAEIEAVMVGHGLLERTDGGESMYPLGSNQEVQSIIDELRVRVREAEARLVAEDRRQTEVETLLQAEVERLRTSSAQVTALFVAWSACAVG
jgi:hypothetical protein